MQERSGTILVVDDELEMRELLSFVNIINRFGQPFP